MSDSQGFPSKSDSQGQDLVAFLTAQGFVVSHLTANDFAVCLTAERYCS